MQVVTNSCQNGAASEYAVLVAAEHVEWTISAPYYILLLLSMPHRVAKLLVSKSYSKHICCRSTMRWPYYLAVGMLHCVLLFNNVLMVQTCLRFWARRNSTAVWSGTHSINSCHMFLQLSIDCTNCAWKSLSYQHIRNLKWSCWFRPASNKQSNCSALRRSFGNPAPKYLQTIIWCKGICWAIVQSLDSAISNNCNVQSATSQLV